jgi:hypothetical protein
MTSSAYRCIEHTIHIMASHFVKKLNIRGVHSTNHKLSSRSVTCPAAPAEVEDHSTNDLNEEVGDAGDEFDEEFDVETCMEVEATADEVDAILAASATDFVAGDIIGKLMAFIAQIRSCSEATREYLHDLCISNGCSSWEIKLWVRTRWGSLSDCFRVVLSIKLVCILTSTSCLNLI